ncbi:MAG: hypothetical protein QOJ64_3323 [Acidobacteriota bacterium]|nr:hypothetical protein [Acidobacteriota bacterium]
MKNIFIAAALIVLIGCADRVAEAQTNELKKFEVGAQYTSLSIREGFNPRTEPGVGGRFTYNLTDFLALEAEGNFFVQSDFSNAFRTGGRAVEGLAGVKIGKRYKTFGIFGKVRPGLISFSQGAVDYTLIDNSANASFPIEVRTRRLTHFAADIGAVLEFYPSRRIVTRIDAGDTIIHFGEMTVNSFTLTAPGTFAPFRFSLPSDTSHNFQFSAGVGFRF